MGKAKALPPEIVLGDIVLFTISDEQVSEKMLETWFAQLGLNTGLLPEPLRAVDAFRKATAKMDGFTYPLLDGTTASVLCRDVSSDNERIVRHMVREVKNSKKERLAYGVVATAVFYKAQKDNQGRKRPGSERFLLEINHPELLPEERSQMDSLIQAIREHYARYCDFHDGQKLRGVVRDYLKFLNAIEIKPSTYFVHSTRSAELANLATLVSNFGGECKMFRVPIVALDEMKLMVIDAFRRESKERMDNLVRDILRVKDERKTISMAAWATLKRRYDEAVSMAKEHCRVLNLDVQVTGDAADLALDTLVALQNTMLEKP